LVERFQVDSTASTRSEYEGRPYLRDALSEHSGWIDAWPDYVEAPLFFVSGPPGMPKDKCNALIKKDITDALRPLVETPSPSLNFHGALNMGR
jgi:hypothetical protein